MESLVTVVVCSQTIHICNTNKNSYRIDTRNFKEIYMHNITVHSQSDINVFRILYCNSKDKQTVKQWL